MKKVIAVLCLTTILSSLSFAQNKTVVINMNNDVLHCPHLGVKFEKVFSAKEYVKNLEVNRKTSVANFELIDNEVKEDKLRAVIVNEVGYPEAVIGTISFTAIKE